MDSDIILKTELFGFDKKKTMDYIEQVQSEKEDLKRQLLESEAKQNALLAENAMLRNKIEAFNDAVSKVGSATEHSNVVKKSNGKIYITKK